MSKETLDELYQLQPNARIRIERSAGYAVFSNFGMRFFIAGGGSGEGLAFEVISGKSIPMKMVELQAGMGMGIKKFRLVWVFDDKANFNTFVNSGWELVGQYSALAKVSKTGLALEGAISVKPGVWLYQITNNGLSLELVVKGSKYYRNSSLN
ncbi:MAG: hypothetical protein SFU98_01005 [Leptospiraceae bacterium]|nr:hypothetical protein [Leptospiraceae bacterium]